MINNNKLDSTFLSLKCSQITEAIKRILVKRSLDQFRNIVFFKFTVDSGNTRRLKITCIDHNQKVSMWGTIYWYDIDNRISLDLTGELATKEYKLSKDVKLHFIKMNRKKVNNETSVRRNN